MPRKDNSQVKKQPRKRIRVTTSETIIAGQDTIIKKKTTKISRKKITEIIKPPGDWRWVYTRIKEFRQTNLAPVDTVGCEKLSESVDPKVSRFQTLIALMLSSQTRDEVTGEAMSNLKKKGLDVDSVLKWTDDELQACISKASRILKDRYDGDIPNTIEGLLELPGVGPKMGYLALQCAWNLNHGIGVDVHVHRITNRLGWVKTNQPEETRLCLESWLPNEFWGEINYLLVGFGQIQCLPRYPKCKTCPVQESCPSNTFKQEFSDLSDIDY